MATTLLQDNKNIHFIGIGGIGLSAIARYLHAKGYNISGSDIAKTSITDDLSQLGMTINIPHNPENISYQDMSIHSKAIAHDNPELLQSQALNIPLLSRRKFLPYLTHDKTVYSVCGAHGKSTTTAILAALLPESSAIIGAESKSFGSNMRLGRDDNTLVFEADESDESFLNSNPHCAIVTNAEPEHMEYYNYDYDKFYNAYKQFINTANTAIINAEDSFLDSLEGTHITKLYPSKDISNIAYELINEEPFTSFELKNLGRFKIWGIGDYIVLDASLAILAALEQQSVDNIRKNITNFKGIKKRFDIVNNNRSIVIDDYGHHPTEIKATLNSVKAYANMRKVNTITTIWQPHKYSRTLDNLDSFKQCFQESDELIILPVWSAGEQEMNIDFQSSFQSYNPVFADKVFVDGDTVMVVKENKVIKTINDGLIVGFGAGDITYQLRGAV